MDTLLKSPDVFIKSLSSGVTQYVMTVSCILIKSGISDVTLLRLWLAAADDITCLQYNSSLCRDDHPPYEHPCRNTQIILYKNIILRVLLMHFSLYGIVCVCVCVLFSLMLRNNHAHTRVSLHNICFRDTHWSDCVRIKSPLHAWYRK